MCNASPVLKLYHGGSPLAQARTARSYLNHLLGSGHAVARHKLVELELLLAGLENDLDSKEEPASEPTPVRAKPWWFRFGGGRI